MKNEQHLNPQHFKYHVPKVPIERGRYNFVLTRCEGKNVLHLGCVDEGLLGRRIGNGTLLHAELEKVAKEVCGVDASQQGIELLQESANGQLFVGNVEQLAQILELKSKKFDVIVAPEIIEHVNNVGLFLESAKTLFSPETVMIITTPNAFRLNAVPYNLLGYEYVHPDHNYWFSWKTLHTLVEKHGYNVEEEVVYSYGVFSFATLTKEIQSLLGRLIGKRIQTYKGDECSRSISHSILDILGFPIRWLLYKLNPFFGEGLIFVIRPKKKK